MLSVNFLNAWKLIFEVTIALNHIMHENAITSMLWNWLFFEKVSSNGYNDSIWVAYCSRAGRWYVQRFLVHLVLFEYKKCCAFSLIVKIIRCIIFNRMFNACRNMFRAFTTTVTHWTSFSIVLFCSYYNDVGLLEKSSQFKSLLLQFTPAFIRSQNATFSLMRRSCWSKHDVYITSSPNGLSNTTIIFNSNQ